MFYLIVFVILSETKIRHVEKWPFLFLIHRWIPRAQYLLNEEIAVFKYQKNYILFLEIHDLAILQNTCKPLHFIT